MNERLHRVSVFGCGVRDIRPLAGVTGFIMCRLGVRLVETSAYSSTRPWAAWFT